MKRRINKTKLISLILVLVGAIIFALGLYAKHRLGEVQQSVQSSSKLFGNNPISKGIEGAIEGKISAYDLPIFLTISGGLVLVIIGAGLFIRSKNR